LEPQRDPLVAASAAGSLHQDRAKELMLDELSKLEAPIAVRIVVYKPLSQRRK
jgi:hypothetical protein